MGDNVPAGPVASWKLPNAGDSDSDRVNELLLSHSWHVFRRVYTDESTDESCCSSDFDVSYQLFCR